MASLTVQDISGETLSVLKNRAALNNRSLNGEVLFIFHWVAEHGTDIPSSEAKIEDPAVARQKREMKDLIGSWKDDRSADEIISDIMKARTVGREVAL